MAKMHAKAKRRQANRLQTHKRETKSAPRLRQVELKEFKEILARARTASLSEGDVEKLEHAVETLAYITLELERKGVTIKRLRTLIFGASTEKTSQVVAGTGDSRQTCDADGEEQAGTGSQDDEEKPKRKGHGRNGSRAYEGAEKVKVAHETLKPGDPCPECPNGKLYLLSKPAVLVRVTGMAPLRAAVYELERLRCNLCGVIYTADAPEGVGREKYDESAAAMIGLLKYGTGMPFNRLERLQRSLGIPLPSSTQWDIVKAAAQKMGAVYAEVIRQAAQGELLHNDDTTARILDLMGMRRDKALAQGKLAEQERTGIFTSGIMSVSEEHKLAVFFTGLQHAGENLSDLLAQRSEELEAPIQMCDALSRNIPSEMKTIVANCIAHARRKFVEVASSFPDEVKHVLGEIAKVYNNEAIAKNQNLSKQERLAYHQQHSGPVMRELKRWLERLIQEHKVEPNSSLGDAIGYMLAHWEQLTLFLSVPGAPLDNNIVERALKRAIVHRKNSLFYRSENGARVGDIFMTLIYSAEINGADPFDYLVAILRHADQVANSPGDWMPWNYRAAAEQLTADTG